MGLPYCNHILILKDLIRISLINYLGKARILELPIFMIDLCIGMLFRGAGHNWDMLSALRRLDFNDYGVIEKNNSTY